MITERKCVEILENLYKSVGEHLTNRAVSDLTVFQKIDM